jgi:hypothetical protein
VLRVDTPKGVFEKWWEIGITLRRSRFSFKVLTKYINYNKMESKDTQGNQLFRESKPSHYTDYTTANGNVLKSAEYDCSVKPVINEELHEIIRRIYDEKLTEEMMAPKLRYDLIRLLLPNVKKEIIANAKSHSHRSF